jgi:hypothetical protein
MVLRSLHRLFPLAQRFLRVDSYKEISMCFVDSKVVSIAPSSFPGLPILLRRQHRAELRSCRLSDPSSRVGR